MKSYTKPQNQTFNIKGVRHISPEFLFESFEKEKILIIDIRENIEVMSMAADIDFILNTPTSTFMMHLHDFPKYKKIVIISSNGINSTKIADLLKENSFKNVYNLDGGIIEWKNKGLPIKGFLVNK